MLLGTQTTPVSQKRGRRATQMGFPSTDRKRVQVCGYQRRVVERGRIG